MMKKKLEKEDGKATFVAEVSKLWPVARGSLSYVRKPCVHPNCQACARGDKHPSWIFSLYHEGKQRCLYVPEDLVVTLRQAIANGRKVEQLLAECGATLVYEHRRRRTRKKRSRKKGE
jgi:hypothetical protein